MEVHDLATGMFGGQSGRGDGTLHTDEATCGDKQYLMCKYILLLIENDEALMKAKQEFLELRFDFEQRLLKKFSPIQLF